MMRLQIHNNKYGGHGTRKFAKGIIYVLGLQRTTLPESLVRAIYSFGLFFLIQMHENGNRFRECIKDRRIFLGCPDLLHISIGFPVF